MSSESSSPYPLPIYCVAHRFYLYSIEHVTQVRREHNIIGVLVGTLPQSPQQNVFLGLPLQLLAEEARLLVEEGHAYVVDDVEAHRNGLNELSGNERGEFKRLLDAQGLGFQKASAESAKAKKELALSKLPEAKRQAARASLEDKSDTGSEQNGDGTTMFSSSSELRKSNAHGAPKPFPITPTTSHPPFSVPGSSVTTISVDEESRHIRGNSIPPVPSSASYALYRHLHSKSYFMSSGLRFGAQYSVYPGDPLRFHAHFLARGFEWEEEIELLSVIGGGRLGTGVKKGYLIGGPIPKTERLLLNGNGHADGNAESDRVEGQTDVQGNEEDDDNSIDVRCFCIEWAGM